MVSKTAITPELPDRLLTRRNPRSTATVGYDAPASGHV
jgi:hypothetical protein